MILSGSSIQIQLEVRESGRWIYGVFGVEYEFEFPRRAGKVRMVQSGNQYIVDVTRKRFCDLEDGSQSMFENF